MHILSGAMLFIVGVIHLLPVTGVLGAGRLSALYGIEVVDPNLLILMQHRAVLFGLLGLFLVGAAFFSGWRWPGYAAGFISVLAFLFIAWLNGGYNEQVEKVVLADLVALACLITGSVVQVLANRS